MAETHTEILSVLRSILADEGKSAAPDTNLFEAGIIDSLGMLDLVDEVEARFEVTLDQSEITIENFARLDSIAQLVRRHHDGA